MNLFSYIQSWFTVQPASQPVGRIDNPSGERVDECDVLALSAAYACTRLIAGTYASLPVVITKGKDGDDGVRLPAREHPLYRLLHDSPNVEQTAYEFFELGGASLEIKGNMLARKEMTGDRVVALEPMRWDETRTYRRTDGSVGYDWRGDRLTADEVLHVRGFGGDSLGGLSTIAVAGSAFGLAKAVNRSAGAVFRNGIRTQTALVSDRDLTPEQMDQARGIIEDRYAGAMNSGRPLLLNNGLKAVPLQMNPEDAQMLESRAFSVEEVCRFFGVPPFMVGHSEKSTSWGTGIEQQTLGFMKFTMRPRLKRMEQALEKQLLSARDRADGVRIEFNVEGLLRASSKERAEVNEIYARMKALTVNEVRAQDNRPPVPWGDRPWGQMQDIQLQEDGSVPPSATLPINRGPTQ